jgi:hypothetical protein
MKYTFLLLFNVMAAFAQDPIYEMEENIRSISSALEKSTLRNESTWQWDVIRVRAVFELGIEVPLISKFSLNPEVEFFFVKK